MTAPTAERLATLVRFHSGCRPDAACEVCEVIALLQSAISALIEARAALSTWDDRDQMAALKVAESFLALVGR